jgi:low affinity Fe/Cu permease
MDKDQENQKYRMICTLSFGDIYGQIIVWLIVIFISLASTLALWSSTRQIYALATVAIVLVLSLPFLLFAFVTTLLNHIEFVPVDAAAENIKRSNRNKFLKKTAEAV